MIGKTYDIQEYHHLAKYNMSISANIYICIKSVNLYKYLKSYVYTYILFNMHTYLHYKQDGIYHSHNETL